MEINVIITDGEQTRAWHINPTQCEFVVGVDGSFTIRPTDSAWVEVAWGLEVATDQQIDPTWEPWPEILRQVAERNEAADRARQAAAEKAASGRRAVPGC